MTMMHVVQGMRKKGWMELGRWTDRQEAEKFANESKPHEVAVRIITKQHLGGHALGIDILRITVVKDGIDRYLKLCQWARQRYTVGGRLDYCIGGKPAPFKRIEIAAASRYLGCTIH